ncbi:PadR family transcriptional regulator [Nannocystis pusilla]|uniref:PadR family transcriptional regulator n=1 Tax=Nannocystis pusilla TaxID=889268 RepID=A0ABS7U071_9BACT|nr:PadR family transcriptional regulator [Nannocystis pusilla]
MSRQEQTHMAVLGALSVEPMSGYALREAIRDVLGHFWNESFGQIYPALTSLEEQGFVARQPGARSGSSVFTLTPAGRQRLQALLSQPIQTAPPRNGLLLRLFFGRVLGAAACRALVTAARDEAAGHLAAYAKIRETTAAEGGVDPYMGLTLSFGEHVSRAVLAWADEALATLSHLPGEPGA